MHKFLATIMLSFLTVSLGISAAEAGGKNSKPTALLIEEDTSKTQPLPPSSIAPIGAIDKEDFPLTPAPSQASTAHNPATLGGNSVVILNTASNAVQ